MIDLQKMVERTDEGKFDSVVPVSDFKFVPLDDQEVMLASLKNGPMKLSDWAFSQVCGKMGVPGRYMSKCPADLKVQNLEYWRNQLDVDKGVLLRCRKVGGTTSVLGFLSESYSIFNNREVVDTFYGIASKSDLKWEIKQAFVSEKTMQIRIVFPGLTVREREHPGVTIVNSEVGAASLICEFMLYRLVCSNGLIIGEALGGFKRKHIGVTREKIEIMYSEFVREVPNFANEVRFASEKAMERQVTEKIVQAIQERIGKQFYEKALEGRLDNVIRPTFWDLANALSEESQNLESHEKRYEIDSVAGSLLLQAAA